MWRIYSKGTAESTGSQCSLRKDSIDYDRQESTHTSALTTTLVTSRGQIPWREAITSHSESLVATSPPSNHIMLPQEAPYQLTNTAYAARPVEHLLQVVQAVISEHVEDQTNSFPKLG
jgi:hypothetical protein